MFMYYVTVEVYSGKIKKYEPYFAGFQFPYIFLWVSLFMTEILTSL